MSLLGVDVGSSTCKAVVFAEDGRILAKACSSYTPLLRSPSFAEIDPENFWTAVCSACTGAAKAASDRVRVVSLSSHGETFVALDSHGQPVRNAILNQDGRAIRESAECEEIIGRGRLFKITGLFAYPMYPLPKILWLRKHEPETFAAAKSFVTVVGYLLHRMGLPGFVDYSLASRFLAFDILRRSWSDEILSATELDKSCLPALAPAGTTAGTLSAEIASQLGVDAKTPVVLGGHDQPCGALGAGAIGGGRVCDSIGTYECLLAASDAPSLNEKALAASLNTYCHVIPEKFVTLAYFPSGIMVKWFHDLLYSNSESSSDVRVADSEGEHYARLEAQSPYGPTGLCITPHLIGTCNPEFNPRARGIIAGIEAGTRRAHIYKGILEGLACELAILTDLLAEAAGEFGDIFVTGGGTRSMLGLRLRAALTGKRLHVMSRQESVCFGTAILGGIAIGEYASFTQAVNSLVSESTVVQPEKELAANYQDQLARYKRLRCTAVSQA